MTFSGVPVGAALVGAPLPPPLSALVVEPPPEPESLLELLQAERTRANAASTATTTTVRLDRGEGCTGKPIAIPSPQIRIGKMNGIAPCTPSGGQVLPGPQTMAHVSCAWLGKCRRS